MKLAYTTPLGAAWHSSVEEFLNSEVGEALRAKVNLVFTSPPFPLTLKKKYGNETGARYVEWLAQFARPLADLLAPDGSLVIEVGNGWEPGSPTMSTASVDALLAFKDAGGLTLCQQFICHNPARMPGPAQWVTVERIRVKDSFTHVWWLARTSRPKADNRRVLTPYSDSTKRFVQAGERRPRQRPSGHRITTKSFAKDNGGAIPPSVIQASNSRSNTPYLRHCRALGIKPHPARMQPELAEFFIKLCTEPGDMVFDPFGGSVTTGAVAEALGRRWSVTEMDGDYLEGSRGHFVESV